MATLFILVEWNNIAFYSSKIRHETPEIAKRGTNFKGGTDTGRGDMQTVASLNLIID